MTITPDSLVLLTASTLSAASLPGTPQIEPWKLWPWQKGEPACVAVLCDTGADAPKSPTFGPANFSRTQTLTIVSWLPNVSTDAALGAAAVALQEAILDALFASSTWCAQWHGTVPTVDWQIARHPDASVRAASVAISIRGAHDLQRDYSTAAYSAETVHYKNTIATGAAPEGETTEA